MLTLQKNQIFSELLFPIIRRDLVALLFVTISFYFIFKWFASTKEPISEKKLPPGPPGLPILGSLHLLSPLAHRSFQSLGRKYGDVMLLHLGGKPAVIVQSADAAREVMRTHDLAFADKPSSRKTMRLMYEGKDVAAAPYGDHWRKLKSLITLQILSSKRVQSFRSVREEETSLLVEKIRGSSSSPVNLSHLFMSVTNDTICRAAFGRKYGGEGGGGDGKKKAAASLIKEVLELLGASTVGDLVPWLSWVDRVNGFGGRVDRVASEVDDFLEKMILELENAEKCHVDNERESFVEILFDSCKENAAGVSLDKDNVKGIILDLLAGGTDTTFATLEWAMTELLRHPKIMKTLQNEVRGISRGITTEEDPIQMPYLKGVIKETLRLHTPAPFLAREAREDVELTGYEISRGTMVITNAWAISRDPRYWEEPEEFRPERFLKSSRDFKGFDFELLPFGSGRRGCPGIAFAMSNVELVLASLVREFDWELPRGGEELDTVEHPGVTVHRKNPLLAVATPRYA